MPTIRQTVIDKADSLGMSAYSISHATKDDAGIFAVSLNHVNEYLAGRKDMTSEKLDAVFETLGLEVKDK